MRILFLAMLILVPFSIHAQCVKHPHAPVNLQTYYQSTNGLTGDALKTALNQIIRGHTRYSYTPCVWEILSEADEAPSDPMSVVGIYTGRLIAKMNRDSGQNDPDSWNREHIWAKSHGFPNQPQHAFTDAHHLRAADRSVNSDRSDNDFDEGGTPDDECTECSEGEGTWEPPDRVKGDIARMMFYMDVRYDGNDGTGTPDLQLVDRVNTQRSDTFGEFGKLCTLVQWHNDDPVSAVEQARNDVVHSWQGNRNPFVDRPQFVGQIWGPQCSAMPGPPSGGAPSEPSVTLSELRQRLDGIEAQLRALRELIEEMDDTN